MFKTNQNVLKSIGAKLIIAGLAFAANYASVQAATSVVIMFNRVEYVYDYGVADTVADARSAAILKLMARGISTGSGYWLLKFVDLPDRGYTVVAGQFNVLNRLVYLGLGFNKDNLTVAQGDALARARGSGATAPKVLTNIADVVIPVPAQISPAANQTGVHRPTTFTWAPVKGLGQYEIQVDFVPDRATPYLIDSAKLAAPSFTSVKLGPGRTYRWRVRVWSQGNLVAGQWSAYRPFSTRVTQ